MSKKKFFNKRFTKLVLSITERIESFFNFFNKWNSFKKNYVNSWNRILDKKIFFTLVSILFAVIVYFLLPSFYDKNKVKTQLENQILQKYNFKVILDDNFRYGLFPRPHFFSNDTKINYDSKRIATIENSKFFISSKNFFSFNTIKIKDLIFSKSEFRIDNTSLDFFLKLSNNNKSDQKIHFIKSKFFYLDQNNDVVFLTDIIRLKYSYQEKFLNKIKSKLKIFNVPMNLSTLHNSLEKKISSEINLNSIKLDIKNDLNYSNDSLEGQINLKLINRKKVIEYSLQNNILSFKTDDNKLDGEINIKPFFLLSNIKLNQIEVSKLLKNNSIFTNFLKSEILNNKNLNGKIGIFSKNLKDSKFINEIKFDIYFEEGIMIINNLNFLFKNFAIFNINDVNILVDDNKLKFIGDIELKFKNIRNFYSHFQIKRENRKNIDQINSSFMFNLDDGFIQLNNFEINGIKNKDIKQYLNNFNSEKKYVLNKIVFRSVVKDFFEKINLD